MPKIEMNLEPYEKCLQCPRFYQMVSELTDLEIGKTEAIQAGIQELEPEFEDDEFGSQTSDMERTYRQSVADDLDDIDEQVEENIQMLNLLTAACKGPVDVLRKTKVQTIQIRFCNSPSAPRHCDEEPVEIHRIMPIKRVSRIQRILGWTGITFGNVKVPDIHSNTRPISIVDNDLFDAIPSASED